MDYIGSKEKLNEWIFSKILHNVDAYMDAYVGDLVFLDGCSGSGAVSRYASNLGFNVVANDLLAFSKYIVLGSTSLKEKNKQQVKDNIIAMNNLDGYNGFFYNNYTEKAGRLYFTKKNAKKIDAFIEYLKVIENTNVKSYLTYCCLEALSRVSNTAGVHAAFLKKIKERANQDIVIREEKTSNKTNIIAYNKDIIKLLKERKVNEDILYLDPPYNERQYGPNYHLYETFVKADNPKIKGKTGIRHWEEVKSQFCSKKTWGEFTVDILNNTTAKFVYISYSSDGMMSLDEIKKIIKKCNKQNKIHVYSKDYKRFVSHDNVNNENALKEYLIQVGFIDELKRKDK